MIRFTLLAAILSLVAFTGCMSPAEQAIVDTINQMNAIASAMESNAPPEKIKQLMEQGQEIGKRLQNVKASAEEQKALEAKYKDQMIKAAMRAAAAFQTYAQKNAGKMGGNPFGMFPGVPR